MERNTAGFLHEGQTMSVRRGLDDEALYDSFVVAAQAVFRCGLAPALRVVLRVPVDVPYAELTVLPVTVRPHAIDRIVLVDELDPVKVTIVAWKSIRIQLQAIRAITTSAIVNLTRVIAAAAAAGRHSVIRYSSILLEIDHEYAGGQNPQSQQRTPWAHTLLPGRIAVNPPEGISVTYKGLRGANQREVVLIQDCLARKASRILPSGLTVMVASNFLGQGRCAKED